MDTIDAEQARKLSLFRPLGKWPVRAGFVRMCARCGGLDIPSHDCGALSLVHRLMLEERNWAVLTRANDAL